MADNKTKGGFKPAPVLRMPTADVTAAAVAPKLVTLPPEPQVETVVPAQVYPASVTLASHYGYIADDGSNRFWVEGRVETDPSMIAELIARKAPLKA